ncbi:hypothetical protein ABH944_005039 [Caballeronia udeis]|uniref:Uncharacterized protein n=1 Tax=Caballeronia udeis TaxID=1232866 RepID=A0ABW8MQZ8_9BURK
MRRRIVFRHKSGQPRVCARATVGANVTRIEGNVLTPQLALLRTKQKREAS